MQPGGATAVSGCGGRLSSLGAPCPVPLRSRAVAAQITGDSTHKRMNLGAQVRSCKPSIRREPAMDFTASCAITPKLLLVGRNPMTTFDRRGMITFLLGGAAAATAGLALMPGPARSAPLMGPEDSHAEPEYPVETAVWVRRRRRMVCWWHRGHRVCRCAGGEIRRQVRP